MSGSEEVWRVEPRRVGALGQLREAWRQRRVLGLLGATTLGKLYRRTWLGRTWLVLRPLGDALIGALVLSGVLGLGDDSPVPYPLFFLVGTTCWVVFREALIWSARSLEINRSLLGRRYVARLLPPLAAMAPVALTAAVYVAVAAPIALVYQLQDPALRLPGLAQLAWCVPLLATIGAIGLGCGLFFACPGARYRDVRFGLGYVVGFGMFLSPVLYPLRQVPERWRTFALLNPLAPLMEGVRWSALGQEPPPAWALALGVAFATATLLAGAAVYLSGVEEALERAR